jgi:7,8-dihydropterin-6-yl-methyl-4-(beta-D-ribofuranosyl)aminobenzene 5'-phosphate synthase
LARFLALSQPGICLYAHPNLLQERFSIKDDLPRSIGIKLSPTELCKQTDMHLSLEPQQMLPGLWTTGEIAPRNEPEGRSSHHAIQENGKWLPDPYKDDLALVFESQSGLVLICGCCHAGLLNTLACIRSHFSGEIQAIIGGLHLINASAKNLEYTISALREMFNGRIPQMFPNHCSGEKAICALQQAFGDLVQPCPAGTVLRFA